MAKKQEKQEKRKKQARHMNDAWQKVRTPIGVDVGTAAVKVAQWDWGKARYGVCDLARGGAAGAGGRMANRAAVVRALRVALKRADVRGREAVLGVGGIQLTVRTLNLPEMAPEELREAARWEMADALGFDPSAAVIDYLDLDADSSMAQLSPAHMGISGGAEEGRPNEALREVAASREPNSVLEADSNTFVAPANAGGKNVLAVAVEKTVVDDLVEAALDCGLEPVAVDIQPAALGRVLWFVETGGARNVAVIDVGATVTEVGFFREGRLAVFRAVPIGAGSLASGGEGANSAIGSFTDDRLSQLVLEITRSVNFFRAQSRWEAVDAVYLVGGGAGVPGLSDYLAAETGLTVRPAAAAAKVPRLLPPEVFGALGLALWEEAGRA